MTITNCVAMNLQSILAVLEIIRDLRTLSRQLLRLPHRNESRAEVIRKRRRKNKPARLHANHRINLLTFKLRSKRVNRVAQAFGMFEQRRDVVKIDAGLGKVRHFANQGF